MHPEESDRNPGIRKRRGAPVVERVLDTVLEILAREGPEGLSIPEVARRAELNKTSLYRRWPDPEALIAAALERSLGHEDMPPDTGSFETDLAMLIERAARWSGSPEGMAILRALVASPRSARLGATLGRISENQGQAPRQVLQRARLRGEIAADVDDRLVLTVIAGACFQRLVLENEPVTPAFICDLASLVVRGTSGEPVRWSDRPRA
jgi:AcrR family transcriptional regulator